MTRTAPIDLVQARLARAEEAVRAVADPEIPVLTLGDLGVLRDLALAPDGAVEVTITPTYSGCPAMKTMELDLVAALAKAGFDAARQDRARAGLDDRLDERGRQAQAADYGIAPPVGQSLAPRSVRRRGRSRLSALRLGPHNQGQRIRLDRLQVAVALRGLSRAVRRIQMHLEKEAGFG